MRLTLKHLLPMTLLLTSILAADSTVSTRDVATTDEARQTTTAEATNDNDDEETTATDEAATTATGTADDEDGSTGTEDEDDEEQEAATATTTTTTERVNTFSWNPTIPATVAPDLNAGTSARQPGWVGLGAVVGLLSLGAAFL